MIHTIYPYKATYKGQPVWQYDDPENGCINQGIVSGMDTLCDQVSSTLKDDFLSFSFSDAKFPGWVLELVWQHEGEGTGLAAGHQGNWYKDTLTGADGWMCPALYKYFKEGAPKMVYVAFGAAPPEKRVKMQGEFCVL